jgi:hypothetical protein
VSSVVFESMEALGANGVLVLSGISGGDRTVEIPGNRIMLGFVLGNKVAVGAVADPSRARPRQLHRDDTAPDRGEECYQGVRRS